MAKVIMVGAAKGGVGKTVSAYNLAYCLAEEGRKVLAVDFDSQANLSTCFGIENTAAVPVTVGHLMMNCMDEEELHGILFGIDANVHNARIVLKLPLVGRSERIRKRL